jgi:hypothetical protein
MRDQDVALELTATAVYTAYAEAVARAGVTEWLGTLSAD